MKTKSFQLSEFKSDEEGSFKAVFSTFGVKDHDGDVTMKDAFTRGQKVSIMQYGHQWHKPPIGKGMIDFDGDKAWVEAKFFLNTFQGMDTYKTIKNMEDQQEWSYGFNVVEEESGMHNGQKANILKKLDVFEVSPVMLGAGIGTRTESIKSLKTLCIVDNCKDEVVLTVCKAHGSNDVVSFAKVLKQALAECDEEVIKALIVELTPLPPAPKGIQMHELLAELSAARANSHSMGGLRS